MWEKVLYNQDSPPCRLHSEGVAAVQGPEGSAGQPAVPAGEGDVLTAGSLQRLPQATAESRETWFPGNSAA